MVATLSSVSSSKNAGKYFYFTENDFECSKSWHVNRAQRELGLKVLNRKSFENILDGKLSSGIELGRKTSEGLAHHPGQELILSAPKSVSIMALVAQDKRVIDAHERAVSTTLDYIQRYMIYARIQDKGRKYMERTDNVPIARFTHMTSRPPKTSEKEGVMPDPQLHTHNIFANATLCQDNKWRSAVFDALYDNQMNIGQLYRMELGRELEKIGYEVCLKKDKVNRWTFEIVGVLESDIQEFSQRRQGILEAAEKAGASDAETLAYLAKITRDEKSKFSADQLQQNWEKRVDVKSLHNIKEASKQKEYSRKFVNNKDSLQRDLDVALHNAIESLSEREAVWRAEDLHAAILDNTMHRYSILQIEDAISKSIENGSILKSRNSELNTYTTLKNLKLEQATIKLMHSAQNKVKAISTRKEVQNFLKDANLNQGQKDGVFLILNTRDRVVGIQGSAGTAKTTMLNSVKNIAQKKGYEFIGLAPTKEAANVLRQVAGIESQTLHLFLAKYDGVLKGRGSVQGMESMINGFKNKIVVLDESSLASTSSIKDLLNLSASLRFRLVLVGDIKQLGAVESGKPFYTLQNHGMNTAILHDIKRQSNDGLLGAVYNAAEAIDKDQQSAKESIYNALKALGKENIVDLSNSEQLVQTLHEKTGENQKNDDFRPFKSKKVTTQEIVNATYHQWKKKRGVEEDDSNNKRILKSILVVVPSNVLRKELNSKIRTHFIEGKEVNHQILVKSNLTNAQKRNIVNYNKGDVLLFNKDNEVFNIEKGKYYRVHEINTEDVVLSLVKCHDNDIDNKDSDNQGKRGNSNNNSGSNSSSNDSKQKEIKWNPGKALNNNYKGLFEIYKPDILLLAKGENIRWTKNSKDNKLIVNGETSTVCAISESHISFRATDGNIHKMSIKDPALMHLDHAYCSTVYAAQGKTVDRVIGVARAKESFLDLTTQRSFYVTLSRARKKAILVTDSYKGLIQRLSGRSGAKTSAIEHQVYEPKDYSEEVADLKKEGRAVYISKDQASLRNNDTENNQTISLKGEPQEKYKEKYRDSTDNTNESYEAFTNNASRVRDVAVQLFGSINSRISQGNNLRFGKKGSISVNISTGAWYDFGAGVGGSLYSLAKNNNLLDRYELQSRQSDNNNKVLLLQHSQHNDLSQSLNDTQKQEQKREQEKIDFVKRLIENSTPLRKQGSNIAKDYLEQHRKINLKDINLSDDLRYTDKAWSSETNSTHPAMISIARDNSMTPCASQIIYLDLKTANKDKSLEITKRSQGILKNSFVELTNNRDANIIFIAEGVETALSIASVKPRARVLCSLGVSNIKNIDLSNDANIRNKRVIICADNDGKDSPAKLVTEQAAELIKDQGFKSVSIIRADKEGQDFNDVLRENPKMVSAYIDPILRHHPDYKKQEDVLKSRMAYLKQEEKHYKKLLESSQVYRDLGAAMIMWEDLVKSKGIRESKQEVKQNPEIIGRLKGFDFLIFKSKSRIEAYHKIDSFINALSGASINSRLVPILQERTSNLLNDITHKHLREICKFSTKNLNPKQIAHELEKIVLHTMAATDQNIDSRAIRQVTLKITEQIIQYRQRYAKEPEGDLKKDFFLRARYEAERQSFMQKHLDKTYTPQSQQNLSNSIGRMQRLERLLSIDSRFAMDNAQNKYQIYFDPPKFRDVIKTFRDSEQKIAVFTNDFLKQGMNGIKANFVATEIVKYEEKYALHMPVAQQESLKSIGDYVSNNYNELLKCGFSRDEARIAYMEGSKLAINYKPTTREMEISKMDIKLTQQDIKRTIERHGLGKDLIKNSNTKHKEIKSVSYGKDSIGLELER